MATIFLYGLVCVSAEDVLMYVVVKSWFVVAAGASIKSCRTVALLKGELDTLH